MNFILGLLFAGCAGYLAGMLMGVKGPWWMNICLGLVGGLVGGLVFGLLGFSASNFIGSIIIDVIGACLVVFIYRQIKK